MEDFFADVAREGGETELNSDMEETTTDSQPETVEETEAPSQEGVEETVEAEPDGEAEAETEESPSAKQVPFHEHPRFKRIYSENKELREKTAELEQQMQQMLEAQQNQQSHMPTANKVPDNLKPLFGEDYNAYQVFMETVNDQAKKNLEEARKQEELAKKEAEQRNNEFVQWANEELASLGSDIGQNLLDTNNTVRNQILKIIDDYNIAQANGYPDFKKAYELHKALYPQNEGKAEKKEIAAKTSSANAQSAPQDEVITSDKLRNTSIHQFFN